MTHCAKLFFAVCIVSQCTIFIPVHSIYYTVLNIYELEI